MKWILLYLMILIIKVSTQSFIKGWKQGREIAKTKQSKE